MWKTQAQRLSRAFHYTGLSSVYPTTLIILLRWLVAAGIFLRFWLNQDALEPSVVLPLTVAVLLLIIYNSVLTWHSFRKDRSQVTRTSLQLQIAFDLAFFSVLYLLTGRAESDFFLFYFIPLFLAAEYLSRKTAVFTFLITSGLFGIVVLFLADDDLFSTFARVFLPRWTFYLVIILVLVLQSAFRARQAMELDLLLTMSRQINRLCEGEECFEELLESVIMTAIHLFGNADAGSVYLRGIAPNRFHELVMVAAVGFDASDQRRRPLKVGEGLAGWVVANGMPRVVSSFQTDSLVLHQPADSASRPILSAICVPIKLENMVLGALCIDSMRHPRAFSDNDIATLTALAGQAAVTISNFRLFRQVQQQMTELDALHDLALRIISEAEVDLQIATLAEVAVDLVDADAAFVCLFREDDGSVITKQAQWTRGAGPISPLVLDALKQAAQSIQNSEQSVVTYMALSENPGSDARQSAVVAAPLAFKGTVIGTVVVYDDTDAIESSQPILERLAKQATLAIMNAEALGEEKRLMQRSKALHSVLIAITSTMKLEAVADSILSGLKDLIPFYRATIQQVSGDTRVVLARSGSFPKDDDDDYFQRPISRDRLISRVLSGNEALFLPYPEADDDWKVTPQTEDVRSWIGVPLKFEQNVVGILTLDHDVPGYYTRTKEFVELLDIFARQVAIAIHNASLVGELNSKIAELTQTQERLENVLERLDDANNLAMIGLIYGEDIHLSSNRLGAAKQFARNIERSVSRDTDEGAKICWQAQRIYENIDEFVELVRTMQRTVEPPYPIEVNLFDSVQRVIEAMRPNISDLIRVSVEFGKIDPIVFGLERQIRQIIRVNLFNAVDAIKSGEGEIKIVARELIYEDRQCIEVAISDTGTGIRMEEEPYLFEIRSGKESRSSKGFGFGLAWSRSVLRWYGGDINYETTRGKGTTMRIVFPRDFRESQRELKN